MKRISEPFIQGPLSVSWLAKAAKVGKSKSTPVVGLLCWHAFYLNKKQQPFTIGTSVLRDFGIERHAFYRALKRLEMLDLIAIDKRKRGVLPKIRIISTELVK